MDGLLRMTIRFHAFGPCIFLIFFHPLQVGRTKSINRPLRLIERPLRWKTPSTLRTMNFWSLLYMKFKNLFSTKLCFKLHQSRRPCNVVPRYLGYFPWICQIMQIFQIWKNCRCRICNFYDYILCKVSRLTVLPPSQDDHTRPASPARAFRTHIKPIFSRLVYFPNLIWLTCIKSVPFNPFPAYNIIIGFLLTLQVLHCIWFYMILRIAASVLQGKPAEDDRSDQEDFEESSEDENQKTK